MASLRGPSLSNDYSLLASRAACGYPSEAAVDCGSDPSEEGHLEILCMGLAGKITSKDTRGLQISCITPKNSPKQAPRVSPSPNRKRDPLRDPLKRGPIRLFRRLVEYSRWIPRFKLASSSWMDTALYSPCAAQFRKRPREEPRVRSRRRGRLELPILPPPSLADFYAFVERRERLRWRREEDPAHPRSWTEDEILRKFRFTNVKRADDRTSRVVARLLRAELERWEDCDSHEARKACAAAHVLNVALWRRFGTAAFIERVGWRACPVTREDFRRWEEATLEAALSLWREGVAACTDAYFPGRCVHGAELRAWAEEPAATVRSAIDHEAVLRLRARPIRIPEADGGEARVVAAYTRLFHGRCRPLQRLWEALPRVADAMRLSAGELQSWRQVVEALMAVEGFGGTGFSAKEVVLDLLQTPLLPRCSDLDSWCPVGPGACRGLNRLHGRPLHSAPGASQLTAELLEVFHAWGEHYPPELAERTPLGLHDVQFQLCEFDKYLRAKNGQGRLRRFVPLDRL